MTGHFNVNPCLSCTSLKTWTQQTKPDPQRTSERAIQKAGLLSASSAAAWLERGLNSQAAGSPPGRVALFWARTRLHPSKQCLVLKLIGNHKLVISSALIQPACAGRLALQPGVRALTRAGGGRNQCPGPVNIVQSGGRAKKRKKSLPNNTAKGRRLEVRARFKPQYKSNQQSSCFICQRSGKHCISPCPTVVAVLHASRTETSYVLN